jgi:hypothetical protein
VARKTSRNEEGGNGLAARGLVSLRDIVGLLLEIWSVAPSSQEGAKTTWRFLAFDLRRVGINL